MEKIVIILLIIVLCSTYITRIILLLIYNNYISKRYIILPTWKHYALFKGELI